MIFENPFFLGIGPARTGTSWLYNSLNAHPQMKMLPDKEIRFFYIKSILSEDRLVKRIFSSHWHYKEKRRRFLKLLSNGFTNTSLIWELNYLLGTKSDNWYLNLFDYYTKSGDISPKYCELEVEHIKNIKQLLPHSKIIISIRNPVDRIWSKVKLNLVKEYGAQSISQLNSIIIKKEIDQTFKAFGIGYDTLIKRWMNIFDDNNVFILDYDLLRDSPNELFRQICDFLSIDTMNLPIDKKINPSINFPLNDLNRAYISNIAQNQIESFFRVKSTLLKE